jgi:hypothetical protein
MNDSLFDLDAVKQDSPRLTRIKVADIQTHHAPHMPDCPWLAIPMNLAREIVKAYITQDEPFDTPADITATFGRILEDKGLIFYGDTQKDAEDDALAWLMVYEMTANQLRHKATEKENQQ